MNDPDGKEFISMYEGSGLVGLSIEYDRQVSSDIKPHSFTVRGHGKNIYIEVKSIDYVGQKFRMTNNEFAAAQYKPSNYCIALVFQNKDTLEISLIKDPINRLNLTRQVVQWVWECSDYEYKPMKFSI